MVENAYDTKLTHDNPTTGKLSFVPNEEGFKVKAKNGVVIGYIAQTGSWYFFSKGTALLNENSLMSIALKLHDLTKDVGDGK